MASVFLRIPQIGEGLQEARIVGFLKQPGESVRRDEPIYQMETDKAVMDVESPYEGVLTEWLHPVDALLAIGAEVGRMEVGSEVETSHAAPTVDETPAEARSHVIALTIPQIGEGLQEARLVAKLKQPGESVQRDEPIYQMETDKAVMDVESPYEGVVDAWLAEVDEVLPIGAEVVRMRVGAGAAPISSGHERPVPTMPVSASERSVAVTPMSGPLRNLHAPPRTRAYAKERGLFEADLMRVPTRHLRMRPDDIDAFLAETPAAVPKAPVGGQYQETPLSAKQRLLASRLHRGSQLVVPGTIAIPCLWEGIERLRARYKAEGGQFQPSAFTMFAYAVAQVSAKHPLFRSTLRGDEILRTYDHANLGVAVALPGDELVLAVVESADTLSWTTFAAELRARIDLARSGRDQANESVTLSLTNMQAFGLRDAVPVVVPPAVGTLFLGEVYNGLSPEPSTFHVRRYANLALTFDHRLINGVGAATFLSDVRDAVELLEEQLG